MWREMEMEQEFTAVDGVGKDGGIAGYERVVQ